MTTIIDRNDAPSHLFSIPELDFSGDLFAERPGSPLGSRNLLQRLTLIAVLIRDFHPDTAGIPILVRQAEGKTENTNEPDLQAELEKSYRRVRYEFAPLAFLYDLRSRGGLAHKPDKDRAAEAASQLSLPTKNWHRIDYLRLLNLVAESIQRIAVHLGTAAQTIVSGGLCESK